MPAPMKRIERALRILIGLVGMAVIVACLCGIILLFGGRWGLPYFSFTSDNGSPCVNTWGGYSCSSLTTDDFELYSQFELPPGTTIRSASYAATSNYSLDAVLVTDKAHAAQALKALTTKYGTCRTGQQVPSQLSGATKECRMSTDDEPVATDKAPPAILYTVATGLAKDGSRITVVHIQSR